MSEFAETAGVPSSRTEVAPAPLPPKPSSEPIEVGPERRGVRSRLWRVVRVPFVALRFLIRNVLWVLVKGIRSIWRHLTIVLLLVLAIYGGYRGYQAYFVEEAPPPAAPAFDIAADLPPADTVMRYLDAQKNWDAVTMWQLQSPTAIAQRLERGERPESFMLGIEQLRRQGVEYRDSRYIGGYKSEGGTSYYFFVTRIASPAGQADIGQAFEIDPDGLILQIVSF